MTTATAVPDATSATDPLGGFHPLVRDWFRSRFGTVTDAQGAGWPAIRERGDCLLAAPTGSGKTLAAFLSGINDLLEEDADGGLPDELRILYVSPLKALSNDIERNLREPLAELRELAEERGEAPHRIRAALRTGDTPAAERQRIVKRPPHILITTPESLYLLLTAEKSREMLKTVETVIVDEIHAVVRDKRGSHLALSLARLDDLIESARGERPVRIGLSATQKPMDEIARFLTGLDAERRPLPCKILDLGHQRQIELWLETTDVPLEAVVSHDQWDAIYGRLAELAAQHRTTLIFVNTRALAERLAHRISERIGKEHVAAHHGSLAKERRHAMEQRLKSGDLRAVVATASLELGIDVGSVDLVCQVGSPRRIATFLQRVGRSGHALGRVPNGALFPTTLDELVECAAMVRAVRDGRLDRIRQPGAPIEVLAQQIVAEIASRPADDPWTEDALYARFRRAAPYSELERGRFDETVEMLAEGVGEGGGRSRPLIHRDRIHGLLRPRRSARITALLNGGVIPETGDFRVVKEPEGSFVGTVNEDFAIESQAGDIFLLGSTSWRIKRVESKGVVRVIDAQGAPPTIPFWLGEAPGRSPELSESVGRLRRDVIARLDDVETASRDLQRECGMSASASAQLIEYLGAAHDALGVIPSDRDVLFERFFDETGGQQLVVHAPFGSGVNRAWGLALRKRFCVRFDFELQAAANEEGIILSLGPSQSFPLEEAFEYLKAGNAEQSLRQAVLYAPFWNTRWRWAATRALAVPRRRGGREVPPNLQRMIADDLLASVFPAQVGCQENLSGPLEVPDHPLIAQTMDDCLHEAVDTDGLVEVLKRVEAGEIALHARDTVTPSPMAQSIINVNPFGFLDDAPLEERRARAVMTRRGLPDSQRKLAQLDPDAIERVRAEAAPPVRDAEELHDLLASQVLVAEHELIEHRELLDALIADGRAARALAADAADGRIAFAAEMLPAVELLLPGAEIEPPISLPEGAAVRIAERDDARLRLVRGHCEISGPVSPGQLAARSGLGADDLEYGLRALEATGDLMRGRYTPASAEPGAPEEYVDRRLLARIHRYTIGRLRREIEPVSAADYLRFLLRWQHLAPGSRLQGKAGVRAAIARLEGFEAPARAWEHELLSARVEDYRAAWLDELCLAGEVAWARLTPRPPKNGRGGVPTKATPITLALRRDFQTLLSAVRRAPPPKPSRGRSAPRDEPDAVDEIAASGGAAAAILAALREQGALFFDEIVEQSGRRIATDVENGLRELVAAGLARADGFQGLRQLIRPASAARRRRRPRYGGGGAFIGEGPAGRWSALPAEVAPAEDYIEADEHAERIANILLQRYGILSRELLTRESLTLPWREILRALRRMEASGEIRGGRFIQGLIGEQFALPEAIDQMRSLRRAKKEDEMVEVPAVDPANLVGVLVPGKKVPARAGGKIAFRNGVADGAG